jgi:hypothetical protein
MVPQTGTDGDDWRAGVGAPARRALAAAGVDSPEELATRTEQELLALHGMGPKAMGVLRAALAERGLVFAAAD